MLQGQMPESLLTQDSLAEEVINKALIWYYRAWSYYWLQEPKSCVIYPAESFVHLDSEVLYFVPRDLRREDVHRLRKFFPQPISFVATSLIDGQSGYSISEGRFQNPTLLLKRFIQQLHDDYSHMRKDLALGRTHEKRRQEWRLGQVGRYSECHDEYNKYLLLNPREGEKYIYAMVASRQGEWRFAASKSKSEGQIISQGDYRRHWNDIGSHSLENLDLFPASGNPVLMRMARTGSGFKVTRRELPRTDTLRQELSQNTEH